MTKTFHLTDKVLHQLDGLTRNPKSYMESSGVVFDRDSSIRWERRSHRLVVTANPGELDLIEALLHEAAATYVDPRKWSDAGHARSRDKLVGRYLWKYGYGSMWLEFARNGTYRMGVHGHMDPEETITKGTWKLRNGWITLHRSDHKKLPSPYCYTYPDGTGWALAIPQPMEEKDTKPKFRGFARRERGPAVSNEGAAIKAVSE